MAAIAFPTLACSRAPTAGKAPPQQREVVADADALTRSKGMIGIGMLRSLAFRRTALGIKALWVRRERGVTMRVVRRKHHSAAGRDRKAVDDIITHSVADVERRRRIEPQRFLSRRSSSSATMCCCLNMAPLRWLRPVAPRWSIWKAARPSVTDRRFNHLTTWISSSCLIRTRHTH